MQLHPQQHPKKEDRLLGSAFKLYEDFVISVPAQRPIIDVIDLMRVNHIGDVIVVEVRDGKTVPIGIITDRDIALAQESKHPPKIVSDCMTSPIAFGRVDDDVFTLVRTMKENGVGRLPLVDASGSLAGIVTAKKIFQKLALALNDLAFLSERQQRNEVIARH